MQEFLLKTYHVDLYLCVHMSVHVLVCVYTSKNVIMYNHSLYSITILKTDKSRIHDHYNLLNHYTLIIIFWKFVLYVIICIIIFIYIISNFCNILRLSFVSFHQFQCKNNFEFKGRKISFVKSFWLIMLTVYDKKQVL